jgi:hypothetical protein
MSENSGSLVDADVVGADVGPARAVPAGRLGLLA